MPGGLAWRCSRWLCAGVITIVAAGLATPVAGAEMASRDDVPLGPEDGPQSREVEMACRPPELSEAQLSRLDPAVHDRANGKRAQSLREFSLALERKLAAYHDGALQRGPAQMLSLSLASQLLMRVADDAGSKPRARVHDARAATILVEALQRKRRRDSSRRASRRWIAHDLAEVWWTQRALASLGLHEAVARRLAANVPSGTGAWADDARVRPLRGRVVESFGSFEDRETGVRGRRNWVAVATSAAAPVRSPARGRIVDIVFDERGQQSVSLRHEGGAISQLRGLGLVQVALGEDVEAGQTIGRAPDSAQPRIEFEVRVASAAVHPMRWLRHMPSGAASRTPAR